MRIGFVFRPTSVNAIYRSVVPLRALREQGHEVLEFPQVKDGPKLALEELASCDVVHVHRIVPNDDDRFVERLQARGVAVVFDNDDDMEAIPPEALEVVRRFEGDDYLRTALDTFGRTLALVPQVDLAIAPSEALAERFRALGAADVRVIDNRLPDEFIVSGAQRADHVTVGWHGFKEHLIDYRALGLDEVLARLLDENPHVAVTTIGLDLELGTDRYRHVDWVDFDDLTKALTNFDVGIAPIVDNAFNRSRSNVKVREYAAAGVPWLASPVGPYLRLGKAQGGRLVEDGEWYRALEELVGSPFKRGRMARKARAWAREEAISRTVHLWEDAFFDALDAVDGRAVEAAG